MDQKRFTRLTVLLSAVAFGNAYAENLLPPNINKEQAELSRCSQGELKAFRWIHVGYAGLYLNNCKNPIDVFNDAPKQLRFIYERSIPAKAFREASEEYLKANLGDRYSAWRSDFDRFNRQYRDIDKGDFYDLIYDAENGLRLFLNNELLGTLDDPEQALAYFTIWFGKEPFSNALKESLLTPEM